MYYTRYTRTRAASLSMALTLLLFLLAAPTDLLAQERAQSYTDLQRLGVAALPTPSDALVVQHQFDASKTAALTFYTDRATFEADFPDLTTEDFDNTLVPPFTIPACPGPFNSATNDGVCYATGNLVDGFSADNADGSNDPSGMVVIGAGALGNATPIIGPNFFGDDLDINFTGPDPVVAAGFDMIDVSGGSVWNVEFFGPSGSLGSTTTGGPAFIGASSDGDPIERIEVTAVSGTGGELIDNLSFAAKPEADLSLAKTCEADEDGTGSYHLTLTNDGPADATGIEVQDWLLDLIDDVEGTPDQGTFNNDTGLWTVGTLAVGSSTSLWITFTFDLGVPGLYLNHAEVTASDLDDPDSEPDDGMGDDYAECGFLVLEDRSVPDFVPESGGLNDEVRGPRLTADIEINKSVDVETAPVGASVHYTVTAGNNGPFSTNKVQVTDHLPDCLVDATWTTTRGDYDGWFWEIGPLKVGETVTLEVWATVGDTCSGTVTNGAWKSGSTLPDPTVSPLDPDAPVENPFDERETRRNNHAEASFDVGTGSNGRMLDGTRFALGNNYPNPFNPTTVVPFSLAEASQVSIKVYDLLGREVAVLIDGALSAGVHEVDFEASTLPTGVYLIRMEAAGTVQIQRVTLMK